jgi:ABC-type multidrug transport system fused ATPase/permease subunit
MLLTGTILLCSVSCQSPNIIQPPTEFKAPELADGVGGNTATINQSNSEIRADATATGVLADEIKNKTKNDEVKGHAEEIKTRVENQLKNITTIDDAVKELNKLHYKILTINRYLFEVEEQNKKLKKLNEDLKKENSELNKSMSALSLQSEKKMMNVLIVVGVVCIFLLGGGIYLTVSGNAPKTGMGLIASSLLMISLTYFMRQQPMIVGIVGGVIFIGFMIVMIYMLWTHKKALFETTDTVEKLKHGDWAELKDEIVKGHSKHTKKLVNEAKGKRIVS